MPKILDISVEDIFEIKNHGTVLTYRPASQQEVDHLVEGNIIRVRYRDEKETTLWEVHSTEWFEIMGGKRGQNIAIYVKPVKEGESDRRLTPV